MLRSHMVFLGLTLALASTGKAQEFMDQSSCMLALAAIPSPLIVEVEAYAMQHWPIETVDGTFVPLAWSSRGDVLYASSLHTATSGQVVALNQLGVHPVFTLSGLDVLASPETRTLATLNRQNNTVAVDIYDLDQASWMRSYAYSDDIVRQATFAALFWLDERAKQVGVLAENDGAVSLFTNTPNGLSRVLTVPMVQGTLLANSQVILTSDAQHVLFSISPSPNAEAGTPDSLDAFVAQNPPPVIYQLSLTTGRIIRVDDISQLIDQKWPVSPNGEQGLQVAGNRITVVNLNTGTRISTLFLDHPIHAVAWSPNGERLAVLSSIIAGAESSTLTILTLDTGQQDTLSIGSDTPVLSIAPLWSPQCGATTTDAR